MPEIPRLVPDRWQPSFKGEMYAIVNYQVPYVGYPHKDGRLVIPASQVKYTDEGDLVVPYNHGALWTVADHSGTYGYRDKHPEDVFYDDGRILPQEQSKAWLWPEADEGMAGKIDSRRFPLHPYVLDMLTNYRIGAVVSTGSFARPGPEETAHGVVLAPEARRGDAYLKTAVVLSHDSDYQQVPELAIRGEEDPAVEARRAVMSKTRMIFLPTDLIELGVRPLGDPRTTAQAGIRSHLFAAILERIPRTELEPGPASGAHEARWVTVNRKLIDTSFGAHGQLVLESVRRYEEANNVTVLENGFIQR